MSELCVYVPGIELPCRYMSSLRRAKVITLIIILPSSTCDHIADRIALCISCMSERKILQKTDYRSFTPHLVGSFSPRNSAGRAHLNYAIAAKCRFSSPLYSRCCSTDRNGQHVDNPIINHAFMHMQRPLQYFKINEVVKILMCFHAKHNYRVFRRIRNLWSQFLLIT